VPFSDVNFLYLLTYQYYTAFSFKVFFTHPAHSGHESPSRPQGAKDHVSGILVPFVKRNSGEVVADNR
jgi:hypothetical protein